MRLDILLSLLFFGAGIVFFAFVPIQEEAVGTSQATEFSSRARTSVSRPGLTPKTSELQKAIEGRLRGLGLTEWTWEAVAIATGDQETEALAHKILRGEARTIRGRRVR